MFENLKTFISDHRRMAAEDKKKQAAYIKQRELFREFGISITHEDKRRIFGYGPDDLFGYFDLQARYFIWRKEVYPKIYDKEQFKELYQMSHAFLSLIPAAIHHTCTHPASGETTFREQTQALWQSVRKQSTQRMEYDDACTLFFSHVSDPVSREVLANLFTRDYSLELTYLFHTKRETCTSLEQARQFDQAYDVLFSEHHHLDISYADHPYSPVFEGTLNAPLPLPGVEIELTAPVLVAAPEPILEEAPQEEVIEAPAPGAMEEAPPVKEYALKKPVEPVQPEQPPAAQPIKPDMSVEHATKVFLFEDEETFDEEEVDKRFKKFALRDGFSAEMLEEIDVAYRVLKAHFEKEMTEAKARKFYDYGQNETIRQTDLLDRFYAIITKKELAHLHERAKQAYQVLLKIAV